MCKPSEPPAGRTLFFTEEVLARHNTEEDCYIAVAGRVYDVTGWVGQHPGGRALLSFAGRDATDAFSAFHSPAAWERLTSFYCGELIKKGHPSETLPEDFRKLRASLRARGLFKSSQLFYTWKTLSTFGIMFLALSIIVLSSSWKSCVWAAFALALFWQQTGWLAHDFLHHQVFTSRNYNNAMGLLLGNVCQGFSKDWWKEKHNTHHAAPNQKADGAAKGVDPDIDTLPYLAWSLDMLQDASPSTLRVVAYQHYYFIPILLSARLMWAQQSIEYVIDQVKTHGLRATWGEALGLALHYLLFVGVPVALLPLPRALFVCLAAHIICGLLLSIVFVQSHNGMEVYSDPPDFFSAQIISTRNISQGLWNDWFSGGLNHQIEHHLFPGLPRHNLHKVSSEVRALCAKHGLDYESCGMATGTQRVLARLAEVAHHAANS